MDEWEWGRDTPAQILRIGEYLFDGLLRIPWVLQNTLWRRKALDREKLISAKKQGGFRVAVFLTTQRNQPLLVDPQTEQSGGHGCVVAPNRQSALKQKAGSFIHLTPADEAQ